MKWLTFLLIPLVILSLLLNWLILQQGQNARLALQGALDEAIRGLAELQEERFEYTLAIDQEVPLQADVLLSHPLEVPISTTIPITTTLETEVALRWQEVEVPIELAIPVDLRVPLETRVPVELGHIPISTTVAIRTQLPIVIEIGQTPLAEYLSRLQQELVSLRSGL